MVLYYLNKLSKNTIWVKYFVIFFLFYKYIKMPNYGTLTRRDQTEIGIDVGTGIGNENFTFEHYTVPSGPYAGTDVTLGLRFGTWHGDGEPTTFNQSTGAYTAVAGPYSGSMSGGQSNGNWNFMWVVEGEAISGLTIEDLALKGTLEISGPNGQFGKIGLSNLAISITSVLPEGVAGTGVTLQAQNVWVPGFSFLQQSSPAGWSGLNYNFDDVGDYTFKFRLLGDTSGAIYEWLDKTLSISVTVEAPPVTATSCFTENAIVKTDQGLLKIKDITNKHTIDNKLIKGISKTTYPQNKIVTIEKNALGNNIPNKKTIVAPFHRFLIDGSLKAAVELVNKDSVYLTKYTQQTLYNIILEETGTMDVNNITVETLDPNSLVAKLFDGSLDEKQRRKIVKSFNSYHKNLKNKPNKTIKDYIV